MAQFAIIHIIFNCFKALTKGRRWYTDNARYTKNLYSADNRRVKLNTYQNGRLVILAILSLPFSVILHFVIRQSVFSSC